MRSEWERERSGGEGEKKRKYNKKLNNWWTVNNQYCLFTVYEGRKKVKMTTLKEKETKIVKFNFLVKITVMMEMLNDKSASTPRN